MNTALQHVGTSKAAAGEGKKKPKQKLPKAAAIFAKQMGLDLSGLEAEADDIWSMLNNMSEDNPLQYESFVQDQLANHKEGAAGEETEKEGSKYFRPSAGFCVRTMTTGGDGIKVREKGQGKKFFINLCSHVALEPPRDLSGKAAMDERMSAEGLQFPLLIGPTRDCQDGDGEDAIAVDVIFHPAVIHHCKLQSTFKNQIVSLALTWVRRDTNVEFNEHNWQPLKAPEYMGGRGVDDSTPVLMSVEHAMKQSEDPETREAEQSNSEQERESNYLSGETLAHKLSAPKDSGGRNPALTDSSLTRSSAALATPQNLLRFSELEKSEQNEVISENIKLSTSKPGKKRGLVQEVGAEKEPFSRIEDLDEGPAVLTSNSPNEAVQPKKKVEKVVKKGFLNDLSAKGKISNIYPDSGSSEGTGGAKGGTYQRFMSKCQVVDTSKMPNNGAQAAPPPMPNPPAADKPKPAPAPKPVEQPVENVKNGNFKTSYDLSQMTSQEINFTEQLADIAKIVGGGMGSTGDMENFMKSMATPAPGKAASTLSPGTNKPKQENIIRVANCFPTDITVDVQEMKVNEATSAVRILVTSLTVEQIKQADLKVSDHEIELLVPVGGRMTSLVVSSCNKMKFKFDVNNTAAKMSKKKCQIEVTSKRLT